jgi:hypothetical protein
VAKPLAKVLAKVKSMSPRSVAKPITKVLRGDVVDEAEGDGKPFDKSLKPCVNLFVNYTSTEADAQHARTLTPMNTRT